MSILTRDLRRDEEAELDRTIDRIRGICAECGGPVEYYRRQSGICARCLAAEARAYEEHLRRLLGGAEPAR